MENCYREEEISRYLDGEINPRQARLIEEHLESCPGCQALARRIQATGITLKAYWQESGASFLTRGTDCPEEGILVAYADGGLREEGEQKEIAAHLAGCNYCSEIVAETVLAADLAVSVAGSKPVLVPPRLNQLIEEQHFPSSPVFLGRINMSLSEIGDAYSRSLDPQRDAYTIDPSFSGLAMVAEGLETFGKGESELSFSDDQPQEEEASREKIRPRSSSHPPDSGKKNHPRGLRWAFDRGEMNVAVEMVVSRMKDVECRINLTDYYGFPLAGVSLRLEKGGKEIGFLRTELNKDVVFPHITRGRYRLTIDHDRDYYLDLNVR